MLAESPYRHELEADIDPFRSILLGSVLPCRGDAARSGRHRSATGGCAGPCVALILVKTSVIFLLARFFGLSGSASIITALLLSQGGEFGFVLFAAAQGALLIEPEAASLFGAVVTLSMAATPVPDDPRGAGLRPARRATGQVRSLTDPSELAAQANRDCRRARPLRPTASRRSCRGRRPTASP
jgi:Kef-type K+ transport system membrane component KefB